MIETLTTSLNAILVGIATLMIIVSGLYVLVSRGNPERLTKAKNVAFGAVSGVVLVVLSGVLINVFIDRQHSQYSDTGKALETVVNQETEAVATDSDFNLFTEFMKHTIRTIIKDMSKSVSDMLKDSVSNTLSPVDAEEVFTLWARIATSMTSLMILFFTVRVIYEMISSMGDVGFDVSKLIVTMLIVIMGVAGSIYLIDIAVKLNDSIVNKVFEVSYTSEELNSEATQKEAYESKWSPFFFTDEQIDNASLGLLIMILASSIVSIILASIYVMRTAIIFCGAVLSPLVVMLYLLPGMRSAVFQMIKVYLIWIFVAIPQAVLLILAGTIVSYGAGSGVGGAIFGTIMGIVILYLMVKVVRATIDFSIMQDVRREGRAVMGTARDISRSLIGGTKAITPNKKSNVNNNAIKIDAKGKSGASGGKKSSTSVKSVNKKEKSASSVKSSARQPNKTAKTANTTNTATKDKSSKVDNKPKDSKVHESGGKVHAVKSQHHSPVKSAKGAVEQTPSPSPKKHPRRSTYYHISSTGDYKTYKPTRRSHRK